jgi:hypothetical protein
MTIRGFADLSVPPLPSFSERDAPFVRQNQKGCVFPPLFSLESLIGG